MEEKIVRYKLGKSSLEKLGTCDPLLQKLIKYSIDCAPFDFCVTCGYRKEKEQNECFAKGTSDLKFPYGKHNSLPSKAVDLAPYPIDWKDEKKFELLGKHIKTIARRLRIGIKWGGDWKKPDLPHYELKK